MLRAMALPSILEAVMRGEVLDRRRRAEGEGKTWLRTFGERNNTLVSGVAPSGKPRPPALIDIGRSLIVGPNTAKSVDQISAGRHWFYRP